MSILENRLQEAWYFHVLSQSSKRIVNLVQIPEHGKTDDPQATISLLQQIKKHDPEAILLYTNKENMELILQQVQILQRCSLHTYSFLKHFFCHYLQSESFVRMPFMRTRKRPSMCFWIGEIALKFKPHAVWVADAFILV